MTIITRVKKIQEIVKQKLEVNNINNLVTVVYQKNEKYYLNNTEDRLSKDQIDNLSEKGLLIVLDKVLIDKYGIHK